jgi:probable sporulation protein (polysaccharide deacetylase family)
MVWQGLVKPTFAPKSPIFQGSPEEKKIALTCNVAWGNEELPKMLEIFAKYDLKVTFFLEGRWAENFPELAKQLAENHEIGNHGYGHKHHNSLSLEKNKEEIRQGQEAIKKSTGVTTLLFAPPYGEWSEKVVDAAGQLDHLTIMWSIDTIDWQRPSPAVIHQRVVGKAHNGAIVLMHPVKQTVEALPGIIEQLQGDGYKLVTVSELLK